MALPEFALPEGAQRVGEITKDGGIRIWHPGQKLGITEEELLVGENETRHIAAQILWSARRVGLRLTPTDGGGADVEGLDHRRIIYRPRDSKIGKDYITNRALSRREGDRTLGVWRHHSAAENNGTPEDLPTPEEAIRDIEEYLRKQREGN